MLQISAVRRSDINLIGFGIIFGLLLPPLALMYGDV
jgi:hypothetical protein